MKERVKFFTIVYVIRNLSVDGGVTVCEEMVRGDLMTALVAFFHQVGAWSDSRLGHANFRSHSMQAKVTFLVWFQYKIIRQI